jgi:hypothetical protein
MATLLNAIDCLGICLGVGLILAVVVVLVFTTLTPDGNDKTNYYDNW